MSSVLVPSEVQSGGATYVPAVHPHVILPGTFTDVQWDEVKKLNPGVTLVHVLPDVVPGQPAAAVSHQELANWTGIVSGILGAAASIWCPAAAIPIVTTILKAGVPFVQNLLGGEVRERWTLAMILEEAATPSAVPAT